MYPPRSGMSGFDNRSDLPPPNYEWSQHDFDSKVVTATERSLHQSFAPVSGPSHSSNGDEFEDWSDEKFEAAARAFEARQAKRRTLGTPQPGASCSSSGSTSNCASSSGIHHNASRPQSYQLDRSQTPKPSDYAQPYSRAPPSVPESGPASAPPITPGQPPTSPYRPLSPSGNAVSNEDGTVATGDHRLQRAVSLFRTPSVSRHNEHGEQLPAFTDVALPEEMVPHDAHRQTSPPPPQPPQSPPPPHTFSAPSGPPSSLHNVRAQVGPASPPLIVPQSPPPPHTFSAPTSPPPSLHNIPPPPLPPLISSPLSLSPATAPTSPIYADPPPAFIPSNSHYPPPEKPTPHVHQNPGNARVISNPMSIYTSANRTHTQPAMKFDLETAYGRKASPGLPQDSGASFYSSAVTSSMGGRQLPRPAGGRPRTTQPPGPHPWTTDVGGQPGTYGFPTHTGTYAAHQQQPHQPGGFYVHPPGQQSYGQNPLSPQDTPWNNQYPDYGLTTPPPGGHGQPPSCWGGVQQPPWTGNGGHYRQ